MPRTMPRGPAHRPGIEKVRGAPAGPTRHPGSEDAPAQALKMPGKGKGVQRCRPGATQCD
eukprot:1207648-Pyramimonas_sp.AAC.1